MYWDPSDFLEVESVETLRALAGLRDKENMGVGHLVQGELYSRPRAENSLPSDDILFQSKPVNPLIEDMHPENSTLFSIQTTKELTEEAILEARGE